MRKNIFYSRGEISTIVIVGMLMLIGVSALLTTTLNRDTQTTQTRASEGDGPGGLCAPNRGGADARGCGGSDGCRDWESCQNGTCLWQNVPYEQQCRASGGTGGSSPNSVPGCFYLEGDVNKIGDGRFDVTIRFVSQGGDGDVTLAKDGVHVAGPNGWNKNVRNYYTYIPTWTGSPIVVASGTQTVTYTGRVVNSAACPNAQATITCTFTRDSGSCGGGGTAAQPTNPPATQPTNQPAVQPTSPPATQPTTPPAGNPNPTSTPRPNTTDGRCTYPGDVDCITLTPAPSQCASPEVWCATLNKCAHRGSCPTPTPQPTNVIYLPIVQNNPTSTPVPQACRPGLFRCQTTGRCVEFQDECPTPTPTPHQTILLLIGGGGNTPTPTPYKIYIPTFGTSGNVTRSGTVTVEKEMIADACLIKPGQTINRSCNSYFMTRSEWDYLMQ